MGRDDEDAALAHQQELEQQEQTMEVYKSINKVQAALARDGISKDRRNSQQGYNFRGIDDVYNALAPLLADAGLCILPRMISRSVVERQTKQGGALFYVTVEAEFDFVSSEDGSKHTIRTFGEAMDSGDKATNKAMSAAYKYAAMQAFAIPTEGDNDADATTHQVAAFDPAPHAARLAQDHAEGDVVASWDGLSLPRDQKAAVFRALPEHIQAEIKHGKQKEAA